LARQKIRFIPERNDDIGFFSFNSKNYFKPISVLVLNESAEGACLALNQKLIQTPFTLEVGLRVIVKIGNLDPLDAIIRWVKVFDDDLVKFGIEYIK
jgi:hypothetical protein